jgi:hypothetical protein
MIDTDIILAVRNFDVGCALLRPLLEPWQTLFCA